MQIAHRAKKLYVSAHTMAIANYKCSFGSDLECSGQLVNLCARSSDSIDLHASRHVKNVTSHICKNALQMAAEVS